MFTNTHSLQCCKVIGKKLNHVKSDNLILSSVIPVEFCLTCRVSTDFIQWVMFLATIVLDGTINRCLVRDDNVAVEVLR